jgi:predicted O-methyltransferase YrrM
MILMANEAQKLFESIISSGKVTDEQGKERILSANIDRQEGAFLQKLVREQKPRRSIEVGFANGLATLSICSALEDQESRDHIVVDPNQRTEWHNAGLQNMRRANINYVHLIEKPSEIALPQLLSEGQRFDLAFIDGWHTFDHALVDFFYIDKMMNVNGVVVIDDISMPSLNKLARYILSNYKNYKYKSHIGTRGDKPTLRRKVGGGIFRSCLKIISYLVPHSLRHRFFSGYVLYTDKSLNLDATMIAIKKTAEDLRSWDSFNDF